jgi:beta-N-acetylhexosaminidase
MHIRYFLFYFFFFVSLSHSQDFSGVDSLVNNSIKEKLFPSAAIAVGDESGIIYKKAYGHFTYDENSPLTETSSMYDLASVTKAFGTNLCVMKLVEEKKLSVDEPVSLYLPEYSQGAKSGILVRNLLLHNSGLPPYYTPKSGQTRDEILDSVKNIPLEYETGTKMVYSCLNFVTLMLIVEKVSGVNMPAYYEENFTKPLGLSSTMFTPSEELTDRCIPTTPELQGVVPDPLARGLEGHSGNAGLFSTVQDLSVICQMLLNNGMYKGKKIFNSETVELFRKRDSDQSTRTLGFDTKSDSGYTSAGKYFSVKSYGHTGYTGTTIWIDPEMKIYSIVLTNRVYPDDTASISRFRPQFNNKVVETVLLR